MIPAGFRNVLDLPQLKGNGDLYFVAGRRIKGFTLNININRAKAHGLGNIEQATRAELRGLEKHVPGVRIGAIRSAKIAGGPARVVDSLSGPKDKRLAQRQIYFEHAGWIYVMTYSALPSSFNLGLKALGQVAAAWRWTS